MKTNKLYAAVVLALAMMFAACPIEIEEEEPALKIAVTGIPAEYNDKHGFILVFNDLNDEYEVSQCYGTIKNGSVGGPLYKYSLYGDSPNWTTKGNYYVRLMIYDKLEDTSPAADYASTEKISIQSAETQVPFTDLELESDE